MFAHIFKFNAGQSRDKDGKWTAGGSAISGNTADPKDYGDKTTMNKDGSITTDSVEDAAKALGKGVKVELKHVDQVATLLDKLADIVKDAESKGEKAPSYDLCRVSMKGTNLFCVDSKGIPRIKMPQLGGKPLPGSPGDKLPKDANGEINLTDQFRKHLNESGVGVEDVDVLASHLKASQSELNGKKIAGMTKALRAGKLPAGRIFVSQDNYVVDGHHRWAANVAVDSADGKLGDLKMPVTRVKMNIIKLLAESNRFAKKWGIPQAGVGKAEKSCKCQGA